MKKNSLQMIALTLALSSVVFVSCDTMDDDFTHADSNNIRFSVDADTDGLPMTRATRYADSPVVMLGEGSRDTLYLHASVDVNTTTVSKEEKAGTRGVPVNTQNFKNVCKDFGVTAYTQTDPKLYMANEKVSTENGGAWSPDGGVRYWPEDDDAKLDFYAHAPYEFSGSDNISISGKTMSFSYVVPTNNGEDAVAQPDIMLAYAACSRSTTNQNGNVPLEFAHALAAVKFVANDIAGCTINHITLKGLYGAGECTFTPAGKEGAGVDKPSGTFAWTCSGNKKDFTQTFNVKLEDNADKDKVLDITDKNPETTFMMIPQQLEGATVEVNLTTTKDGFNHTLEGKLASGNLTEWKAGNIYTYKISSESINWTYVFDVTPSINLPLGGTSSAYTVKSYRYRAQDPSVKEPVAWSVNDGDISGTETQYNNGDAVVPILDTAIDEIIRQFTYDDDGDVYEEGTSYPIVVERTYMATTWEGDDTLRAAAPKGTADNPYDLSTEGETIAKTTANCYVVNAAGTYKLPLVYGNAIVNGKQNPGAYDKDPKFVDYNGNHINSPYLPTPDDATLVWSDGFYMFKDVRLSADKKYLIFTIDPDYIQQANAVVAVRDAQDNIMWSWHIWVTEHPVLTETAEISEWQNTSNKFHLMEWNLGWVDGKMVFYNPRKLDFVFTQDMTGTQQKMTLTQEGAKLDYKDIGSTYYQWGRKDPIVALKNRNQLGVGDYRPMETPTDDYQYKVRKGLTYMKDAIRNPNIYYVEQDNDNEHKWLYSTSFTYRLWDGNSNNYAEIDERSSIKTVYDPSPRGFKVPFPRVFAGFVHGSTGDGSKPNDPASVGYLNGYIDETGYKYHVYLAPYGKKGDPEITFTATGQRASRDNLAGANAGGLWAMDGVYFWTCNAIKTGQSYTFVLRKDLPGHGTDLVYSYGFSGTQAMARPVRCMKE
ncbi:MAG: fimbrillin family protein [Prevotella sp.]|nr:fimbrillin family protein [Prevotella sp.]